MNVLTMKSHNPVMPPYFIMRPQPLILLNIIIIDLSGRRDYKAEMS